MPAPSTTDTQSHRLKSQATNLLGPRLDAIFDLVTQEQQDQRYDNLWDCCCDHGYLGMKLLAAKLGADVCFVDQVPHIVSQLKDKLDDLTERGLSPSNYQTITADAAQLSFAEQQRHLVILAGVGGEHIVDILRAIEQQDHRCRIDYLLCPTTTQFDLREFLIAEAFGVKHEQLVAEKGRDYEVLLVTAKQSPVWSAVTPVGRMWDANNPDHKRYQTKLTKHYRKQMRGKQADRAKLILEHYLGCFEQNAQSHKGETTQPLKNTTTTNT